MLAPSHNPFVSKILPLTLYSAKILTMFTAQVLDSTRWEGGGGIPTFRARLTIAAERPAQNGGEVDQSDSVSYYAEDRDAGFVLLCTGKPRSALRILTDQQKEMREHRRRKKLSAPYS